MGKIKEVYQDIFVSFLTLITTRISFKVGISAVVVVGFSLILLCK